MVREKEVGGGNYEPELFLFLKRPPSTRRKRDCYCSSGRPNFVWTQAEVNIHDEGSILTKVSIETQENKNNSIERERSQPHNAKINVKMLSGPDFPITQLIRAASLRNTRKPQNKE